MKNINEIKKKVYKLNLDLINSDLIFDTFGNASLRYNKTFIIKPSGVDIKLCHYNKMAVYGQINSLNPSVDSKIHEVIYNNFPKVNSIIHTHSTFATAFAQASKKIECIGTTHADYFKGDIPIINYTNAKKTSVDYEYFTGMEIIKYFKKNKIDYLSISAALLKNHGVIVWGENDKEVFKKTLAVEYIAKINYHSTQLNHKLKKLPKHLLEKHFERKNGKKKYYGQIKN
tara:strand:- start:9178 stop:9864 length:687 start_codon:yes stop_codon:yes gene_type:complete